MHRPDRTFCSISSTVLVRTYKHDWLVDLSSGNAYKLRRGPRWWSRFLPYPEFRTHEAILKNPELTYDAYYYSDEYAANASAEADIFVRELLQPHGIHLSGRRVLDISGGSGPFSHRLREAYGADVTLTEFSRRAVEHARDRYALPAVSYDFQKDRLSERVQGPFDLVLFRAAIMFCLDLDDLASEVHRITSPGSYVIFQHVVVPTLGTILRTQFDEYTYLALYQPEHISERFGKAGFETLWIAREIDPSPWVYNQDRGSIASLIRVINEYRALQVLPFSETFPFRAQDRRRAIIILRRR